MFAAMSRPPAQIIAGFTAGERDYIRRELDMFFSTLPRVAGYRPKPGGSYAAL